MAMDKDYHYISNLENPQRYQYTKYLGKQFINDYILSREEIISSVRSRDHETIIAGYNQGKLSDLTETDNTKERLSMLICIQKDAGADDDVKRWLDMFVKKFEVSKKIFTRYGDHQKKRGDDYHDRENYVLLAVNLAIYCSKKHDIKFLNTLLKLDDLICSFKDDVSANMALLINFCISTELKQVNGLLKERGIEI